MTITLRTSNVNREGLIIDNQGYLPTIGMKNGYGKLYQPGTRGLVVNDSAQISNRPCISTYVSSSNKPTVRYPSTYGYATAWVEGSNVYAQSAVPTDHYGIDDTLKYWANIDLNYYALLPVSKDSYGIDTSRWGDKPVSGTYDLVNSGGARALITPNKTIYKWEVHVMISQRRGLYTGTMPDLPTCIKAVYIPRVTSGGTYVIHGVPLAKTFSNSSAPSSVLYQYTYYKLEMTVDLAGGTILAYPVIIWGDRYFSIDQQPEIYVQTDFCFKND